MTPAQQVYLEGRKALDENSYGTAIRLFNRALALDSQLIDAWLGLGVALNLSGRPADSIKTFRQAIELSPSNATAHANLGLALLADGQKPEARDSLNRAVALAPDDSRIQAAAASLPPDDVATTPVAQGDATPAPAEQPTPIVKPAQAAKSLPSSKTSPTQKTSPTPKAAPTPKVAPTPTAVPAPKGVPTPSSVPVPTPGSIAASRPSPAAPTASKSVAGLVVSDDTADRANANAVIRLLSRQGFSGQRVGPAPIPGPQVTTEIHYRKGFERQVQALQAVLPVKSYTAQLDGLPGGVNIRLLVGRQLGIAASK